jgi:PRC-barrel domain
VLGLIGGIWLMNTLAVIVLALWLGVNLAAADPPGAITGPLIVVQATVPPTGMGEQDRAMAAEKMPAQERMRRRFPQPAMVASLIGLPLIDENARTLGYVRRVVRNQRGAISLIIAYGGWFGWGTRLIAVPIEVVGIAGRQLVSLDMPASDYVAAPTWQPDGEDVVPNDASISVALARR